MGEQTALQYRVKPTRDVPRFPTSTSHMELTKQVCSLELAKRLKELGVKQDGLHAWWVNHSFPKVDKPDKYNADHWRAPITYSVQPKYFDKPLAWGHNDELCSAFTVAELGEFLPASITLDKGDTHNCIFTDRFHEKWLVGYTDIRDDDVNYADTEADARAECLIYLLEHKLTN
jgi:hypothetical protein